MSKNTRVQTFSDESLAQNWSECRVTESVAEENLLISSLTATVCYRGHTELPPQLGAGDDPEGRGPGVRLRGGVHLQAAHPGDDPPHPLRALPLPLHRPGADRPPGGGGGGHLDRSGALLFPSHLQPSEETGGLEVPLLHVRFYQYCLHMSNYETKQKTHELEKGPRLDLCHKNYNLLLSVLATYNV